jgi:hypothetical protein
MFEAHRRQGWQHQYFLFHRRRHYIRSLHHDATSTPLTRPPSVSPSKDRSRRLFCLGLAIIAVAIVRLTQIIGHERADPVGLAVWGIVESTVSVIIGCLPPLKSFLGKQISKFTGAIYNYGGGYSGGRHSGNIQGGSGNKPSFASRSGKESNSIPLHDRSTDVKPHERGQAIVIISCLISCQIKNETE